LGFSKTEIGSHHFSFGYTNSTSRHALSVTLSPTIQHTVMPMVFTPRFATCKKAARTSARHRVRNIIWCAFRSADKTERPRLIWHYGRLE